MNYQNFMLAEVTATYKQQVKNSELELVNSSQLCADFMRPIYEADINFREVSSVVFVNNALKVLGWSILSQGAVNGVMFNPRIAIQLALSLNATGMFIMHNHPSGNLRPSARDKELTERMKEAADLFAMRLHDHIILTDEGHFSFADEGIL